MQHFTSLFDITIDDVHAILYTAARLKQELNEGSRPPILQGHVLAQVFEKPSLRTRNSFEAAMAHLGGAGIFLSAEDAGFGGRESLPDIARVLSSYSDAIVLRTFSHQFIVDFAQHADCPVINGLSDQLHPCQALTDMMTIKEVFGGLDGQHLVFIGDGNNVARSLANATAMLGLHLTIASPVGFELSDEFIKDLQQRVPTARIDQSNDASSAVRNADIVYTDVWASMGQEAEADRRKQLFAPFQVNAELMALAPSGCRFMHDLPAKRGLEVTDDVIDGPGSIVFQQAQNRMHLAKGLLAWLLNKGNQP